MNITSSSDVWSTGFSSSPANLLTLIRLLVHSELLRPRPPPPATPTSTFLGPPASSPFTSSKPLPSSPALGSRPGSQLSGSRTAEEDWEATKTDVLCLSLALLSRLVTSVTEVKDSLRASGQRPCSPVSPSCARRLTPLSSHTPTNQSSANYATASDDVLCDVAAWIASLRRSSSPGSTSLRSPAGQKRSGTQLSLRLSRDVLI